MSASRKHTSRLLVLLLARLAQAQIVSVARPAISFFWSSNHDTSFSAAACSPFFITLTENSSENTPDSVAPFTMMTAPVGGMPSFQRMPGIGLNGTFTWTPTYDIGTTFFIALSDSDGHSGGLAGPYQILSGSNTSCIQPLNKATSPISFTASPTDNACSELDLTVNGGTAPYQVDLLAPATGLFTNSSLAATQSIRLQNIVSGGQGFYLFVTDANSVRSLLSPQMMSGLDSPNCQLPGILPPVVSNLGSIIGGIIGGVVGGLFIAIAAYLCARRSRRKQGEQARQMRSEIVEYKKEDGSTYLVTPFVMHELSESDLDLGRPHPSYSEGEEEENRRRKIRGATESAAALANKMRWNDSNGTRLSYDSAISPHQQNYLPSQLPSQFSQHEYRQPSSSHDSLPGGQSQTQEHASSPSFAPSFTYPSQSARSVSTPIRIHTSMSAYSLPAYQPNRSSRQSSYDPFPPQTLRSQPSLLNTTGLEDPASFLPRNSSTPTTPASAVSAYQYRGN